MTVHRPHPIYGRWPEAADEPAIYHDPDDAILFDNCDRCTEQSADYLQLSPDKIGRLWSRMLAVERHGAGYRTRTEAAACRELYRVALLIERTHPKIDPWTGINPWTWPWTTPARWTSPDCSARGVSTDGS